MKNLNLLSLLFVLLLCNMAKAENSPKWEIIGQVVEASSDNALSYVTVTMNLTSDSSLVMGTITDDEGKFEFSKVPENNYFLTLSFIGFEDVILTQIPFDKDQKTINMGTIFLHPASELIDEVVVSAKTSSLSQSVDKQTINVSQNLTAAGGTAVDALKLSPAIQIDANDEVKLRGSSEFIVLIDGKPTTNNPNDVLKQTPGNQIKNIEIITNPSVKYSSEGGAGIINIIMKKGYSLGMNGLVNTTLGSRNKYGANANFNWNKDKLNLSASLNWRDFTQRAIHEYSKTFTPSDTSFFGAMDQDRVLNDKNLDLRLGLNYQLNEQTDINYAFHGGQNRLALDIETKTYGHSFPETTFERYANTFRFRQKPAYLTNNFGINRSIGTKGQKLEINAYYSYIDYYMVNNQIMAKADQNFMPIDPEPYKQDVINDNYSNDLRINIDHTLPINQNFNLESGGFFHRYQRNLDITYSQFDYGQYAWIDNPLYTNKFDFDEDVSGAYANVNGTYLGIQMTLGLRAEYTDRFLKQRTAEAGYAFNRLNWFPAFSFNRSFNDKHQWGLAMSNRINRPDEYFLNPYPEFEDAYFASKGNPHLIPELVRNLEMSYKNIGEKSVLSANLFYRHTSDKIEQLLVEDESGKLHTTFHNNASDRSIGLELMGDFNPNSWWNLNASGSVFQHHISGQVVAENIQKDNISWSTQLVNSFQIDQKTNAQLICFYRSTTQNLQYNITDFFFTDVSVKRKFFHDKLDVGLTVKDVFGTMNYKLITEAQNTVLEGDFNNESPIVLLNVSYQISQYQKKTKDVHTEFDM